MSDTTAFDDDASTSALADPTTLRDDPAVTFGTETKIHADPADGGDDPCLADTAVVGVTDADCRRLLLVNREHGVALLPHGQVGADEDWAEVARLDAEGQTGVAVRLDGVLAVREVEHRFEADDESFATTHRVVFAGSPDGGELQTCKRDADAGSDRWVAGWYDDLPAGVEPPEGGPGEDLALFQ